MGIFYSIQLFFFFLVFYDIQLSFVLYDLPNIILEKILALVRGNLQTKWKGNPRTTLWHCKHL